MTFENFSMPFFTPMITIRPVTPRKIVWQISGPAVEVAKSENIVAISAVCVCVNSKRKALNRYSMPQPPTTE